MKNFFLSLLTITLITTLGCSSCKKETLNLNDLPPITQTGANTLGFTLNGKPWKPQGQVGLVSNLAINVDFGFNKGILVINAYRYISSFQEPFTIGIKDSLCFLQIPITIPLNRTSLYGITYTNKQCNFFNQDFDVQSTGSITILKLDKTNKIIAGTFTATLSKSGCDTIKITEGRFDMKF